jgi:hypothetical protein
MPEPDDEDPTVNTDSVIAAWIVIILLAVLLGLIVGGVIGFTLLGMGL